MARIPEYAKIPLPDGAVMLGRGGSFLTIDGMFKGWSIDKQSTAWGKSENLQGTNPKMFYAVPFGSKMAVLNGFAPMESLASTQDPPLEKVAKTDEKDRGMPFTLTPGHVPCASCWGTGLDEHHNYADGSRPACEACDGYGMVAELVEDIHSPGAKDDAAKPMMGLLLDFSHALSLVGDVCTHGARKYSEGGWLEVQDGQKRYTHAMMRHLLAHAREPLDASSELPHLAHLIWNALAILELQCREAG